MRLGRRIVSVDLVLVNHALVVASGYRRPVGASAAFVNAMHRILIALVVAGVTPMLFFSGVDAEPGEVATQELRQRVQKVGKARVIVLRSFPRCRGRPRHPLREHLGKESGREHRGPSVDHGAWAPPCRHRRDAAEIRVDTKNALL